MSNTLEVPTVQETLCWILRQRWIIYGLYIAIKVSILVVYGSVKIGIER